MALKITLAVVFSALLLVLLFQFVSVEDIAAGLLKLSPQVVIASFLLYVLSYVIRALRFRLLLPDPPVFRRMLGITAVHTFFITVLPFRLGEASYLYLTSREKAKLGHGMSSLAVSRVFDIAAVGVYFIAGAFGVSSIPEVLRTGLLLASLGFVLLVALLCFSILFTEKAHSLLHWFVSLFHLSNWNWTQWVADRLHDALDGMSMLRSARVFFGGLVLSILLWGVLFTVPYVVFSQLGIGLSVSAFLLASSFHALSNALPIQGVLGIGSIEATWAIGLVALGVPADTAISASFVYHGLYILFILLLGPSAWLLVRKKKQSS